MPSDFNFPMNKRLLIRAESISKEYLVNQRAWGRGMKDLFTLKKELPLPEMPKVQALKDISFDLYEGQSLGIIGRNGAGKSTLLKILSGITSPSTGRIELYGRTLSILDIGTGFHPDLTGRENIFMSGSILGMSKKEVTAKFDEIIAFSGVADYIDLPVKRFSSGMYLRLAFSVIAHLEAEIMIFDEVMSVGDAKFRMKSMAKIHELARSGRTLILVSHNMSDVMTICDQCIMLDKGSVLAKGDPFDIISTYMDTTMKDHYEETAQAQEKVEEAEEVSFIQGLPNIPNASTLEKLQEEAEKEERQLPHIRKWDMETAPGDEELKVISVSLHPAGKPKGSSITREDPVCIQWKYWKADQELALDWALIIYDQLELPLLTVSTVYPAFQVMDQEVDAEGLYSISCTLPGNFFNRGIFLISLFGLYGNGQKLEIFRPLAFQVTRPANEPKSFYRNEQFKGPVRPLAQWEQ